MGYYRFIESATHLQYLGTLGNSTYTPLPYNKPFCVYILYICICLHGPLATTRRTFGWYSNPVEEPAEPPGSVGLPSCWEPHCANTYGTVDLLRAGRGWERKDEGGREGEREKEGRRRRGRTEREGEEGRRRREGTGGEGDKEGEKRERRMERIREMEEGGEES